MKEGEMTNCRLTIDSALGCRFSNVEEEYRYNPEQPSELLKAFSGLKISDRRLLILYAELRSLRKVAELYNCSEKTIRNKLKSIKQAFNHLKK